MSCPSDSGCTITGAWTFSDNLTANGANSLTAYKINSDYYVDGIKYKTCQAAIAAASITGGRVIIPFGFSGTCTLTSQPSNVFIYDYRGGGLVIGSTATSNATAQGPGLIVNVGNMGTCSNNPGPNNVVGIGVCNFMSSGIQAWGINPAVALMGNTPDAGINGSEIDIQVNRGGSYPRSQPYIGQKILCTGPVGCTWAQYAGSVPGTASFTNGFGCLNGVTYCFNILAGSGGPDANGSYKIARAITRTGRQTVSTDGVISAYATNLGPGMFLSVDTGANHEDVQITEVSGSSLTATFRKTHAVNTSFFMYSTQWNFNANSSVAQAGGYYDFNLQAYRTYNAANPAGHYATDINGVRRGYDFFGVATGLHTYQDMGNGAGWAWWCTGTTTVCFSVSGSGAVEGKNIPIVASLTTTAGTSDNVTLTGMTSSGHCSINPTNASAAANITATYISVKTTNQINVTHAATAGMTYDVLCTPN